MRFPRDVPTLTSDDGEVVLRAHRPEDATAVVEMAEDPQTRRWTTVPEPYGLREADDFLLRAVPLGWQRDERWMFAVESTHPDGVRRFSGTVGLIDRGARRAEVTYGGHPTVRGRGVLTRAVDLLLDWAFTDRGLEAVLWMSERGNLASRRLAWRLGFTVDGVLREWLDHRDRYPDAWVGTLRAGADRTPRTPWLQAPVLDVVTEAGEPLRLRAIRPEDADRVAEACSDPRTQHWLPELPSPYTPEDGATFALLSHEQMATGEIVAWVVVDPASDLVLANVAVGLHHHEIGYWAHPDARGRGVVTAATRTVAEHALAPQDAGGLGLHRVHLRAADGNRASVHVAEAAGFTRTGRQREGELLRDGSRVDVLCFDRLATD